MSEQEIDKVEIRPRPVDADIGELMDKLLASLPSYAKGAVYIDFDDVWRPVVMSKQGNYYTRKKWRPLLGFDYILLARKLQRYIGWMRYRYCDSAGYLITRDKKIYICCVYQPERNIYILYPKAYVTLLVLIEDLKEGLIVKKQ